MKKFFILTLVGILAAACELPKDIATSIDEIYNEEFANTFGDTDPNHTWSMVDNKYVELNLEQPSRVKIYVKTDKDYKLAGDYENVSGNCELSFDAPMGCTDVYVTVNGIPYQNDKAKMRGMAAASEFEADYTNPIESGDEYVYYKFEQIKMFKKNAATLPERVNNSDKVNMDYRVISNGNPYKFYPLFWNADYKHSFGLYYFENGERKEIDFYIDKQGDCLQFKNSEGKWQDIVTDYAYEGIFAQQNIADSDSVLRGKYFTINLPKGTEFGFYVDVTSNSNGAETFKGRYYSAPELNPNASYSTFAYMEMGDNTYITIEDRNDDDFDYNDFIFIMEGTQEHITKDPVEYVYAVEDLGSTCDFDFNDIVFSVSHVNGQEHANVKLLAAGGTLPAYICFNNYSSKEVHQMFGVDTKEMVNTKKGITKESMKAAKAFTVTVGKEWSHMAFTEKGNGFKVKVKKNDKTIEVQTPGANSDAAPQMLILPSKWLWPTERTSINDAYPSFGLWGANYTNTEWVNEVVNENVINWVTE